MVLNTKLKNLIWQKVYNPTEEQIEYLSNNELAICDRCSRVDTVEGLNWLMDCEDDREFMQGEEALCDICYGKNGNFSSI